MADHMATQTLNSHGTDWKNILAPPDAEKLKLLNLLRKPPSSRLARPLILQKRALRLRYIADWHDHAISHAIPLFLKANVVPITFLSYESVSALMYDINNNKAPVNMSKLFQKTSNIHSFKTRSSTSGKFYVKSFRLEIQNKSFSRLGVKLWNNIPSYLTNLPKKALKRVHRKLLFDVLKMEDDYIEMPLIIKELAY